MAIDTYGDLKAALANWLTRGDLTARIPEFVELAEADIKRKLRRECARSALTASANPISLPAWEELKAVRYNTTSYQYPLQIVTYATLADLRSVGTGRPSYAAVVPLASSVVSELHFDITPDTAYTLEAIGYLAVGSILGADGNTSVTLTKSPDIYLYGSLIHSAPFLEHDDRLAMWRDLYESAIEDENNARERMELGASPMNMGLPIVF